MVHYVGLYCTIILQYTVQKTKNELFEPLVVYIFNLLKRTGHVMHQPV